MNFSLYVSIDTLGRFIAHIQRLDHVWPGRLRSHHRQRYVELGAVSADRLGHDGAPIGNHDSLILAGQNDVSGFWPVAAITISVSIVDSEPLTGIGLLPAALIGFAQFHLNAFDAVTLPALR